MARSRRESADVALVGWDSCRVAEGDRHEDVEAIGIRPRNLLVHVVRLVKVPVVVGGGPVDVDDTKAVLVGLTTENPKVGPVERDVAPP